MKNKNEFSAENVAKVCLTVGAVFGVSSGLISLSQLPWYSALGVGLLIGFSAFLFVAVLWCIEPIQ